MEYSERLNNRHQSGFAWVQALLLAIVLATAFVTPMLFLGNASGHDFQPHVASWLETTLQWHDGYHFPRWAAGANFGFGEPRFIFYPPASWILGGALGSVLPWRMVPGAFIWLTIILASMSMWFFASEWLSPAQSLVAAILYVANPYTIALIYYRSDFAEFLASAFFPLMVCGAVGVVCGSWRRLPLLAIAIAAIWLANAPAAVVAMYSVSLILLVGCVVHRSFSGLWLGIAGVSLGLVLAGFYIVPAWWEQRFVTIAQAASSNYTPERNFLFTILNDPGYVWFNWKISAVALAMFILTAVAILFSLRQQGGRSEVWWMLVTLFCAGMFLMFPISAFFWRHLPQMRFLQFPWRWLLATNLSFAFFAALAGRHWWQLIWWSTVLLTVLATMATIAGDTVWDSEDVNESVNAVLTNHGYDGIDGFAPRGTDPDSIDEEAPTVGQFDPDSKEVGEADDAKIEIREWDAERRVFDSTSSGAVTVAPKLFDYPAWEIRVDGRVVSHTTTQIGQLIVPLDGGTHHIEIVFLRTRDRLIGGIVSALGVVLLILSISYSFREPRWQSDLRYV